MKKAIFKVGLIILSLTCLNACGGNKNNEKAGLYTEDGNPYRCSFYNELNFQTEGEEHVSCSVITGNAALKYKACSWEEENKHAEILISMPGEAESTYVVACDAERIIIGAGIIVDTSEYAILWQNIKTNEVFCAKYGSKESTILLHDFPLEEVNLPIEMMIDSEGFIHIDDSPADTDGVATSHYCVFSPDGKLCKQSKFSKGQLNGVYSMPDGRITYDCVEPVPKSDGSVSDISHRIIWFNHESGNEELIREFTEKRTDDGNNAYALCIYDDDKLVYMNKEGVFLSDNSMNESEKIFDWISAGLNINEPFFEKYRICVDAEGNITARIRNMVDSFVEIKRVTGDVKEVTLAIPKYLRSYSKAVSEFNFLYPQYRISIKEFENSEKDGLYTKIMAGDAPLLMDASLVPFSEKEEYWLPLNKIIDMQVIDELNESAVKLGSVKNTLYGVVSAFNIDTIVSCREVGDWTYEGFFDCLNKTPSVKTLIGMRYFGNMNDYELATSFFNNGWDDSYYLSSNSKGKVVDKEKLDKVLEVIKKYPADAVDPEEVTEALKDGRLLGVRELISSEYSFAEIYSLYGKDVKFIGYPGTEGAQSFIQSAGTLVVSAAATEEEKEIAGKFIKLLLSYDIQKYVTDRGDSGFSSRKDVLKEQLKKVKNYEGNDFGDLNHRYTIEEIDISMVEEDMEKLLGMCKIKNRSDGEYMSILEEEFDLFFQDAIDESELIKRLDSRLGLLLREKQ